MISDKLFELAFKFRKTKLWNILHCRLFFAVKLSDNRIGYIRMTRGAGECYALELYIGEEGLESLRTMIKAERFELEPLEYQEAPLQKYCLQCAMVGKEGLPEQDREEAKAFAHSHGIRISGKNAYPRFAKFQPYYLPWSLQTKEEQENLCEALAAAIEISGLLEGKKLDAREMQKSTEEIILLERQGESYVLGKIGLCSEKERQWPKPEICNDISIAKLKKIKRSGIWECGLLRVTNPVTDEKEEIPVFPIILFAVNSSTGYILPVSPMAHYEENPDELMDFFIETLLGENICPAEIWVKDSRTYEFFKPLCKKLKMTIKEENYLPALEDVEATFYSDFGSDDEVGIMENPDTSDSAENDEKLDISKNEALQDIAEMLDVLLQLGKERQYKPPKEILNQFIFLTENVKLPKSLEDKILDFLRSAGIKGIKLKNTKSKDVSGIKKESSKTKDMGRPKLVSVSSKMAKEAEGKSYVISVSIGVGCYRHIQISCNAFLLELHSAIIDAFGFMDDHAHAFFMDDKVWSDRDCYFMEEAAEDFHTTKRYRLSQAGLYKGMKFKYLFDFGDEWRFQCKVLRVLEEVTKKPVVIKVKGEAPEQYPDE